MNRSRFTHGYVDPRLEAIHMVAHSKVRACDECDLLVTSDDQESVLNAFQHARGEIAIDDREARLKDVIDQFFNNRAAEPYPDSASPPCIK